MSTLARLSFLRNQRRLAALDVTVAIWQYSLAGAQKGLTGKLYVPDKLKTQFCDDACIINNCRTSVIEYSSVVFNLPDIILHSGDPPIKSILESCFDEAQIHRVSNGHGVNWESIEIDGNVEVFSY